MGGAGTGGLWGVCGDGGGSGGWGEPQGLRVVPVKRDAQGGRVLRAVKGSRK